MSTTVNHGAKKLNEIIEGLPNVAYGPYTLQDSYEGVDLVNGAGGVLGTLWEGGAENNDHLARCDPATMYSIASYVSSLETRIKELEGAGTFVERILKSIMRGRSCRNIWRR